MLFWIYLPSEARQPKNSYFVPLQLLLCLVVLMGSLSGGVASAQSLSDIEQIQKQQDEIFRERQREQQPARPDIRLDSGVETPSGEIPENEAPCFVINKIHLNAIDGGKENKQTAQDFQWALNKVLHPKGKQKHSKRSPLLGKCYGVQGINAIMRRLQNVIVKRGYVTTRVVAGPQDLQSGELILTIIPGRIRDIQTDRNQHLLPLKKGAILNLRHIEQALENLKTLPSVQTDIRIVPAQGEGVKPGESDLVILWQQARPWRLGLSVDNSGSESTGEHQGSLSFSYDDLANLNDSLTVSYGHDLGNAHPGEGGTESYSVRYSFPIKNWSLAFSISENEFKQTIEGAFVDTRYSGKSKNVSVSLSRLIYRDQRRRLNAGVTAWTRESRNFIEDIEVDNQYRDAEGFQLALNYREFIGSSIFNASATYHQATDMQDQTLQLSTDDDNPTPAWLSTNFSIDVPFGLGDKSFRYFGQIRYQDHFDSLSSQDYFTIGNRYNVRVGNNSSSLSAEGGWMLRNDIEMIRVLPWANLYLGLDYGEVNGDSFQPNWKRLSAGTVGVKGRIKGFSYDLSYMSDIDAPKGFQSGDEQVQFSLNYLF